ncbi:ROK family protein [Streptomyces luteogriseus]|uniref:ROK family protein n=1 Tax=Streptomyces luteogriseus TaxID=68233 RepID=UPI0037B48D01
MAQDSTAERVRRAMRDEVLDHVRRHGSASRPELESVLGMSRPTVAAVAQELLDSNLLTEHQGTGAGRGRPGRRLLPQYPPGAVVGVDLGHRHLGVAVATFDLTVQAEARSEVDVDGDPDAALSTVARLIRRLVDEVEADFRAHGTGTGLVTTCVAGVPGPLNAARQAVASPTILAGWSALDLAGELSERTGLTVHLDNDANLGALAEHRHGAARGNDNVIYVKASDGVGAGLIINGSPVHGSSGAAGEIGHTQITQDGAWCRCGNRGCLETIVSTQQILHQMAHLRPGESGPPPRLHEFADHPVARKIFAESGRTLGRVLANLCALLDPATVVIGGEMSQADAFVDGIRDSVRRLAQPGFDDRVQVSPAALGLRAELMGSLTLARDIALRAALT